MKDSPIVVGVIPEYPEHSKENIYGHVRLPPVGIVSVLTHVRDMLGLNVFGIDENNYSGPRNDDGRVNHWALQGRHPPQAAMLYGGMTNSIPRMFTVAKQYKNMGAITIAGGSHVDAMPKEALDHGVDIVVHGEGDLAGVEILRAVMSKGSAAPDFRKNLEGILGISFLDASGQVVFTGPLEPIANLDALLDPDLTILRHLEKRWSAIPIAMGRGCKYHCEYCVVHDQYGPYKRSSPEKGFEQVVRYSDMGYSYFFIADDNFAQDPEAAIAFSRMVGNYRRNFNKKIHLMVQVRTEAAENDELIDAMEYGGVHTLAIGVESPIDEELRAMKKGVTVDKLKRRLRKLSEHFYVHQMYIFGYPAPEGERFQTGLSLRDKGRIYRQFFNESKGDTIQVLNTIPLPGTPLRARLEQEGRVLPNVGWEFYDGLHVCIKPGEGESDFDLRQVPQELMTRWYLGGQFARTINYGNWMNWAYNATVGFPIQMAGFYAKRLLHNAADRWSVKQAAADNNISATHRDIFYDPLRGAIRDVKRKWRNLAIKTYGGRIVQRWMKIYEQNQRRGLV